MVGDFPDHTKVLTYLKERMVLSLDRRKKEEKNSAEKKWFTNIDRLELFLYFMSFFDKIGEILTNFSTDEKSLYLICRDETSRSRT